MIIMLMNKKKLLESFGNNVRARRNELGLSQEELADRAGIHRTYIGDVERGERNLSLANIYKISLALKIPMYTLFKKMEPNKE